MASYPRPTMDGLATPDAPAAALPATPLARVDWANSGSAAPSPFVVRAGGRDSSNSRCDGAERRTADGPSDEIEWNVSTEESA